MKQLSALLTALLLCASFSFAQQKIAVVDIEATVAGWNQAVRLDQMLQQKSSTLKKMVDTWLDKLQHKYDEYDKQTATPTQQNTLAAQILDGQEEILLFETILVDSIPRYRREVLQLIQDRIQETIDAVAIANDYDLIIAKDNILYFKGREIDELIVTYSEIDLRDIRARVEQLDIKLTAWIEDYTYRIDQY